MKAIKVLCDVLFIAVILSLSSCGGNRDEVADVNLGVIRFEVNDSVVNASSIYSGAQIDSIYLVNEGNSSIDSDLVLSVTSSNQALLPNANIIFSGTNGTWQISFTTIPGEIGETTLTGTVTHKFTNESISCTLSMNVIGQSIDGYLFPAVNSSDMIHNRKNNTLYISNGTDILHYDVSTGVKLETISVGGQLLGLDIDKDYSEIAIADDTVVNNEVNVHFLGVSDNALTSISFPAALSEAGTYSVAYTSDNNLISTSTYNGSGWVPLRHFDTSTGEILYESSVRHNSMLSASADDHLIAIAEYDSSLGPYGIYDHNSLSMSLSGSMYYFLHDIAIDRTKTFIAIPAYQGLSILDSDGNLITSIPLSIYGSALGVAFNPVADFLYVSWAGSTNVRVFNSLTHEYIETINLNTPNSMYSHGNGGMDDGHIKISDDGTQAFIKIPGGIYSFRTSVEPGIAWSGFLSP